MSNKNLFMSLHSPVIHNIQKVETIRIASKCWINKQNAIYPYNGMLLDNKKEQSTKTCYSMDEPWKHYAKVGKARHERPHDVWFHLCELSRLGKSIETQSRLVAAVRWGEGKGLLTGTINSGEWWKCSKFRLWWWLHHSVNILKTVELKTK